MDRQFSRLLSALCCVTLICVPISAQEYSTPTRIEIPGFDARFASFDEKGTLFHCGFSSSARLATITWDLAANKGLRRLELPVSLTTRDGGVFSPDGKMFALNAQGSLAIFDAATGTKIKDCEDSGNCHGAPVFLMERDLVAIADSIAGIKLWSIRTGKKLVHLGKSRGFARHFAASDDGTYLVSQHRKVEAGTTLTFVLFIWDTATGKETWSIKQTGKEIPIGFGTWGVFSRTSGSQQSGFRVRFSPEGEPFFTPGAKQRPIVVEVGQEKSNLFDCRGVRIRDLIEAKGSSVLNVSFSPSGNHVALIGVRSSNRSQASSQILVYDFPNWNAKQVRAAKELNVNELQSLWRNLASADDAKANHALFMLRNLPKNDALGFLKRRVPTIKAPDPKGFAGLIRDLESNVFAVREKAAAQLKHHGLEAVRHLRSRANIPQTLEQKRRMEFLVEIVESEAIGGETVRGLRVLDLLEEDRSPAAIELVKLLAKGTEGAWLTLESKATLNRMAFLHHR